MKTKISTIFRNFVENERAGGFLLVAATILSITIANSPPGHQYVNFWHREIGISFLGIRCSQTLTDLINDGLMTAFFLLVGLEIKRELYKGELAGIRNALLPIIAATGGMVVPGVIHLLLNYGTPAQSGFGIPMATDIAFSLGVLSLLGRKVPVSLKIVLTALAIIDDIGAILVIVFFYIRDFSFLFLHCALIVFVVLIILNLLEISNISVYVIGGILMWFFMLKSGVHATIAGVLLAFSVPFREGDRFSPSYRIQKFLDKPVALLILPVFVLANTGILFSPGWSRTLIDFNTSGVFAGLVFGKPLGIVLFSLAAVKLGLCRLPEELNWRHMTGLGCLGGIGFTMSIFIANLAFPESHLVQNSKIAIFGAAVAAAVAGIVVLSTMGKVVHAQKRKDVNDSGLSDDLSEAGRVATKREGRI